mgnify:CR=1 FL=1
MAAGGAALSLALIEMLLFESPALAQEKSVSFYKDVVPILKKHCSG